MAILHYVSTNHQFLGILLGTKGKLCSNYVISSKIQHKYQIPRDRHRGGGVRGKLRRGLDFEVRPKEFPPVPPLGHVCLGGQ